MMNPKVLSLSSYIVLVLTLLFLAITYRQIAPMIPIHYGINGDADSWGTKDNLWYIAIGNIIANIGLAILRKRPDLYNYPFKVTDNNRDRVYTASTRLVATLQLVVTTTLAILTILGALSVEQIPPVVYLYLILSPFICLIWGIQKISKAGKIS